MFIERLSSSEPIPGGGAAAAYAATVALALLEKISRVELGRYKGPSEERTFWEKLLKQVLQLKEVFDELREEDGRTYMKMVRARESQASQSEQFKEALKAAVECPVSIMKKSNEALECVRDASRRCKKYLLSDLLVVAELLSSASRGACHIAVANVNGYGDAVFRSEYLAELERIGDETRRLFSKAESLIT